MIKFIRKILLYIIIIGLGLIATQNYWVDKLVEMIIKYEGA